MINNNTGYPDLLILDVRSQVEYDTNHLFDAILIPDNEIAGRLDELAPYNDTEIVVYCRTGGRSLAASNILVTNNFSKIFNMLGGINSWIAEGYDFWQNEVATSIDFTFPAFLISVLGITIILLLTFNRRWKRIKGT
jgi:rhodanese-related sulfurtransferase